MYCFRKEITKIYNLLELHIPFHKYTLDLMEIHTSYNINIR